MRMSTGHPTSHRARRASRVAVGTLAIAALMAACATRRGGESTADSGAAAAANGMNPGTPAPDVMPASSNARIALEVDGTSLAAGATVHVRIVNRSDAGYGFSACQRSIEWRRSGEWFSVPEEGRMCTMILQLLGPRQTTTVETQLPETMVPGEYRIVMTFSREEGPAPGRETPAPAAQPLRVASDPFRVE
jgi:hypothetical protein